jgi:hypothetical protein
MFAIFYWDFRGNTMSMRFIMGAQNKYTFMHKGKFYTLLLKDAKDIKCTIEVFKQKSAQLRSKPRTFSLQGRGDDVVPFVLSSETSLIVSKKYLKIAIVWRPYSVRDFS